MKKPYIPDGMWPVMLTPYNEDGSAIDYEMLEKLVNWYIDNGSDGLFAVCQSSEMFFLSAEERKEYARTVVRAAAGRVPVVASGHVADDFDTQLRDANEMYETGIDALVLLPNRFATQEETDDVFIENMDKFIAKLDPSIPLGIYECPYPYKRVLTPEVISFCADTGRFTFMKDTCCDADLINAKIRAGKGVIKLFNANCAQLLQTLRAGASGFSGVMANFHPELYAWLCKNFEAQPELAERVQNFLGVVSAIESRMYPVCAKKYLKTFHFPEMSDYSRTLDASKFVPAFYTEVVELEALYADILKYWNLDLGVRV